MTQMIPGFPALGVRFDIDRVGEGAGAYGFEAWKVFWLSVLEPPVNETDESELLIRQANRDKKLQIFESMALNEPAELQAQVGGGYAVPRIGREADLAQNRFEAVALHQRRLAVVRAHGQPGE